LRKKKRRKKKKESEDMKIRKTHSFKKKSEAKSQRVHDRGRWWVLTI